MNEIVDPGVALKWNALAKRAMETIRKYSKDAYILVGGINYNSVLSVPRDLIRRWMIRSYIISTAMIRDFSHTSPHTGGFYAKGLPYGVSDDGGRV